MERDYMPNVAFQRASVFEQKNCGIFIADKRPITTVQKKIIDAIHLGTPKCTIQKMAVMASDAGVSQDEWKDLPLNEKMEIIATEMEPYWEEVNIRMNTTGGFIPHGLNIFSPELMGIDLERKQPKSSRCF